MNRGIRLLQDIQWKKNWAEPSCWKHLLRSATRKGQLCHPIQTPWRSFYPDSFFATVFWALGCVQSGPLPAQNRLGKAWPRTAIHTPQAGPWTHTEHTHNQKWKLQQKAPQHHPGDRGEIREHIWLTLVSLSRHCRLLQSLWGGLATTMEAGQEKHPPVLKLRNIWGNLFTINTNRSWGICKSFMIFKASGLVC